jgi:hypothetical protein
LAVDPFFTSIATSLAGELLKQAGRAGFAAIWDVARWWP